MRCSKPMPTARRRLALKLALLTGARIGEILSLAPEQIDAGRKLWIKQHPLVKQKRLHVLPLQAEALAIAEALLAIGLPTYWQVRMLWERVRVALGRREATIHDLRHSRASALARSGASLPKSARRWAMRQCRRRRSTRIWSTPICALWWSARHEQITQIGDNSSASGAGG